MKVWVVLKSQHDETIIEEMFKLQEKAVAHAKILELGADKYTHYYVEEWEVIQ